MRTTAEARRGRALFERIAVRWPPVLHLMLRATLAMPRSSLRTRLVRYIYRRAYAAFNRRDWELNTLAHADDYIFRSGEFTRFLPDARDVYRGREGYLEAMELWLDAWTNMRIDLDGIEIHEAGGGRMVAITPFVGAGELSGARLDQRMADVQEFRQGRLISQTVYLTPARALGSVGLTPSRH